MRRGYVDTAKGQMHYREAGEGQPLLLVHQALRSSLEWRLVTPLLADSYRVISVDLMGYGDSDMPEKPLFVEDHARCLKELIDGLGLKSPALAGHHTGGNVVLECAALYPEAIDKLVLSGPAVVVGKDERCALVSKMSAIEYPRAASDGSHLLPIWREGLVSSFDVPRLPATETDLLADFFIEQIKVGPRRKEAHIAAFTHDALDRMKAVEAPTLVMVGVEDMWCCTRGQELVDAAEKTSPRLLSFPMAGEMPRLAPETFASAVREFLA